MAFIEPMHRNKPSITYKCTYSESIMVLLLELEVYLPMHVTD